MLPLRLCLLRPHLSFRVGPLISSIPLPHLVPLFPIHNIDLLPGSYLSTAAARFLTTPDTAYCTTDNMPQKKRGKFRTGYKGALPDRPEGAEQPPSSDQQPKTGKKEPLTHFLCIPLVTEISRPQLESSLAKLKADVCDRGNAQQSATTTDASAITNMTSGAENHTEASAETHSAGPLCSGRLRTIIPEKAIRPVGTLHLTLGVMSLIDEARIEEAKKMLSELDLRSLLQGALVPDPPVKLATLHKAVSPPPIPANNAGNEDSFEFSESTELSPMPINAYIPLKISLRSLQPMQSPASTSSLYATAVDPSSRLRPFCQALVSSFREAGLLIPDNRPLKLHATVINTIYAKSGGRAGLKGQARGGRGGEVTRDQQRAVDALGTNPDGEEDKPLTDEGTEPQRRSADKVAPQTTINTDQAFPPQHKSRSSRRDQYLKIDARELLPQYADLVWAENIEINKVAICKMGAKKIIDSTGDVIDEVYEEVASASIL